MFKYSMGKFIKDKKSTAEVTFIKFKLFGPIRTVTDP